MPTTFPRASSNNASRGHDGRSYGICVTRRGSQEVLYTSPPLTAAGFNAEQIYDIPWRLRDMRTQGIDVHALSALALNFLVESVGPERVMLGTDYSFDMGDYSSVKTVASLPHSSDTQKDMMYGGNAEMLFKIPRFR